MASMRQWHRERETQRDGKDGELDGWGARKEMGGVTEGKRMRSIHIESKN